MPNERDALTDIEIIDMAADFKSQYMHGGTTFDEFDEVGFARALMAATALPATSNFMKVPYEGYVKAFYELAALMDIGGQPVSPETVWREQMLPRLKAALSQPSAAHSGDAERLDWLDIDGATQVFHLGPTWYTRHSYGQPYRRRANLRDAIDAARAAQREATKP